MDIWYIHYGYVLPSFSLFSTKTIRQGLQKIQFSLKKLNL